MQLMKTLRHLENSAKPLDEWLLSKSELPSSCLLNNLATVPFQPFESAADTDITNPISYLGGIGRDFGPADMATTDSVIFLISVFVLVDSSFLRTLHTASMTPQEVPSQLQ